MEQITTSMSEMGSKNAEDIGQRETSNGNDKREAQIIKNNISQYWKNYLHDRKSAYWKHFRSMKLAELYKEICPEENPFVPRKFRITINETAHQEEKDLRSKQSIQHLRDEIEILISRSTNFKNQFRDIDERIKQFQESQTSDPRVRSSLFTLWKNDCKTEENTSHKIWENDEKFLRSTYNNEKAEETNHTLLITQEIQTGSMNNNWESESNNNSPNNSIVENNNNFNGNSRILQGNQEWYQ